MRYLKKFLLLVLAVCVVFNGSVSTFASENMSVTNEASYPTQYLKVNYPEDSVVLDQQLPASDPAWEKAGIVNVKNQKNIFKNNGITSMFCDIPTKSLVYYITNTQDTYETFDISSWTDERIVEYAKGLYGVANADENVELDFGIYNHSQTKFFTIEIEENGDVYTHSLIYATIINGMLIEYFINNESVGGVNREYIEKIVDCSEFTRIMTKEEYDAEVERSWHILLTVFISIVALIVLLIVLNKIYKNKRKKRNEELADKILQFRNRKQNGEVNISKILYTVESEYNSDMIDNFVNFNTWLKPIVKNLIWAAVYAFFTYLAFKSETTLTIVVAIAAGVTLLYVIYSKAEKYKENLKKQYDIKAKKKAVFRFYEEYFTMSGINSISEFIYPQITSVRRYRGYMYLYMSDSYAVMIDINDISDEVENGIIKVVKEQRIK